MNSEFGNTRGYIENFNPVLDSLFRPKETFLHVRNTDSERYRWLLVYCLGLVNIVNEIGGDTLIGPEILVLALIFAPLAGYIELHFSAFLLDIVGSKFHGRGSREDLRIAVLWSRLPQMAILPALVFVKLANHSEFYNFRSAVENDFIFRWLLIISGVLGFVIGIWCFINHLKMISEAQGFPVGTAFLTWIIPGLVMLGLGLFLLIPISLF